MIKRIRNRAAWPIVLFIGGAMWLSVVSGCSGGSGGQAEEPGVQPVTESAVQPPPSAPDLQPTAQSGGGTAAPQQDGPFRAFTADSYWNSPLPADAPIDPKSAAFIDDSVANTPGYMKLSMGNFAQPIYFAAEGDPLYTVKPTKNGPAVSLHIPAGATQASGSDGQFVVFDTSLKQTFGLHGASFDGKEWHADGTDRYWLDSEGLDEKVGGTKGNTGHRGVPPPIRAVRLDEAEAVAIRHRLECFWHATASSHVFPMSGHENNKGGKVPEGYVVRIKPSVVLTSLNLAPQALVLATALQQYGCVVGDNAGQANAVKMERTDKWQIDPNALKALPWSMYEFIEAGYRPPNK
ncbi:MAG: uncharacterized protein K0R75_103 [Paenibacillaceae bacterium]|jgi:hypothetical protein|nr:uncharacterized protein [Paenibacillaceae bacterium]